MLVKTACMLKPLEALIPGELDGTTNTQTFQLIDWGSDSDSIIVASITSNAFVNIYIIPRIPVFVWFPLANFILVVCICTVLSVNECFIKHRFF